MKRWQPWTLAAWLVLGAGVAVAQSSADDIVEQLRNQGYVQFEVSHTLLGRLRVVALAPDGGWREIVINRGTGEILRDYSERADGSPAPMVLIHPDIAAVVSPPDTAAVVSPPDTAAVVSPPDTAAVVSSPDVDAVVRPSDSDEAVSLPDTAAVVSPSDKAAAAPPDAAGEQSSDTGSLGN